MLNCTVKSGITIKKRKKYRLLKFLFFLRNSTRTRLSQFITSLVWFQVLSIFGWSFISCYFSSRMTCCLKGRSFIIVNWPLDIKVIFGFKLTIAFGYLLSFNNGFRSWESTWTYAIDTFGRLLYKYNYKKALWFSLRSLA